MIMRVLPLGGALIVVGLLLCSRFRSTNALPLHLSPWLAFAGFLAAGSVLLKLEFQTNSYSVTLTDIPIVVGLLSMSRLTFVVAAVAGWAVSLLVRTRAPLKIFFNTALLLVEVSLATSVFDLLVTKPKVMGWGTWLCLAVALLASNIASSICVSTLIYFSGDRISIREGLRNIFLGLVNGLMSLSLTIVSLQAIVATPHAAVLVAVVVAVTLLPLRLHTILKRRYDGLLLLHEFTAGLTSSTDLMETLNSVLSATAKVLRAEHVTIALGRNADNIVLSLNGEVSPIPKKGDEIWNAVVENRQAVRLPRKSLAFNGYLAKHDSKDLMSVPLVHGDEVIGVLTVRDRFGDVSSFDKDDLSIFTTMANQTTATLENLRLIDQLRDESAERRHQALHDELTGLPNRANLYQALEERLVQGNLAVVVLDLNRFKEINDTMGHHVGDEVLVQTAHRIRRSVPSSAHVARLGGDEFAVVLVDVRTVEEAIEKLKPIEAAFEKLINVEALSVRIDLSIGIAFAGQHGNDRSTLLRRADIAMYAAKKQRGTSIRQYHESQEQSSKRSLELISALREAIAVDALDVAFQPKADLISGTIIGAEALARWTDATFGRIEPDEFIPLAEQAGLLPQVFRVVLMKSLESCAQWNQRGYRFGVAVNIDAETLLSENFVSYVIDVVERFALDPRSLTIEITERDLVREIDEAKTVIEALRSHGVKFSIDDFGTGYSSLNYLVRLPVDEVKIDRSFVNDVTTSPQRQAIIRAVADIARSLELTTVVEGIEDEQSWDMLASLGCNAAQGYFLSPPMPGVEFTRWLGAKYEPSVGGGLLLSESAKAHGH
jgi:diguanylate cyclase (GGDEF)-like protein